MNRDEFEAKFKGVNEKADPVADNLLAKVAVSRYSAAIVILWTLAAFSAGLWAGW